MKPDFEQESAPVGQSTSVPGWQWGRGADMSSAHQLRLGLTAVLVGSYYSNYLKLAVAFCGSIFP